MRESYTVRRFEDRDANEVSELIIQTLRTTNIRDYSSEYIENDAKRFTPKDVIERSGWTHFYVVCDKECIVGCGAIGSYWGKEDDYFLRAKRVEIPASITACEFYKKMGYTYKNGMDVVDEERLFRLEKFR